MATPTFDEAVKLITEQAPHLVLIDNKLTGIENGIVSFDVRIYNGEVQDVVVKNVERYSFAKKNAKIKP
jgi:hypothetical protein